MPDRLNDPFGRTRLPGDFSREGRIALLDEVFRALVDGRMPSREAALLVGGGGLSWLSQGGDLLRDYWRISAPAGSHRTPAAVKRELSCSSRGTTDSDDAGTIDVENFESDP